MPFYRFPRVHHTVHKRYWYIAASRKRGLPGGSPGVSPTKRPALKRLHQDANSPKQMSPTDELKRKIDEQTKIAQVGILVCMYDSCPGNISLFKVQSMVVHLHDLSWGKCCQEYEPGELLTDTTISIKPSSARQYLTSYW